MSKLPWDGVRAAMKGDDGKTRVPDGWYDCKIASAQAGQTGSGLEKVSSRLIVLSGPYEGASVFLDFIVTPDKIGGLEMLGRRLAALGITDDMLVDTLTMEGLAKLMIGRTAQLKVGTRTWNDKEYDDIKEMKPLANPGGGFAFGPGSILPTPGPVPVPSGPGIPAMPIPGTATGPMPTIISAVAVPPMEPVGPVTVSGDNGLPPEPPF